MDWSLTGRDNVVGWGPHMNGLWPSIFFRVPPSVIVSNPPSSDHGGLTGERKLLPAIRYTEFPHSPFLRPSDLRSLGRVNSLADGGGVQLPCWSKRIITSHRWLESAAGCQNRPDMAILYAVVARGTVVLAEFSAVTGNTGAVARRILEKLPSEADSRLCFSQDRYIFHILKANGLTFLCMANDTFGSASWIPFRWIMLYAARGWWFSTRFQLISGDSISSNYAICRMRLMIFRSFSAYFRYSLLCTVWKIWIYRSSSL